MSTCKIENQSNHIQNAICLNFLAIFFSDKFQFIKFIRKKVIYKKCIRKIVSKDYKLGQNHPRKL